MQEVSLHDTLSKSMKPLRPGSGDDAPLGFYCCGPTVYGPAHIGNFRTFVLQDTLRRTLEVAGYKVRHVRNLTDVDDKTIQRSREEEKSLTEFTGYWTKQFHTDAEALNLMPPTEEPKATDFIEESPDHLSMVGMIRTLVEKDHAYVAKDGSVYYRVRSFPGYGKLSHFKLDDLSTQETTSSGARNSADEYDRDTVSDFALWKSRKDGDGDCFWQSPWGEGRPGWHIECSVMSMEFLGETFDLHGGGVDLCFPHHENEIAQSEACTGHTFARHWMHCEHLLVDGAKMSKSLGNLYRLQDLAEKGFNAMEVRYLLIAGHYRKQLNFTLKGLEDARQAMLKLRRGVETLLEPAGWSFDDFLAEVKGEKLDAHGSFARAWDALRNDLNTPAALGSIFGTLRDLTQNTPEAEELQSDLRALARILFALGIDLTVTETADSTPDVPREIQKLAEERWEAKKAKDWGRADALRNELTEKGWQILDSRDGYEITPVK